MMLTARLQYLIDPCNNNRRGNPNCAEGAETGKPIRLQRISYQSIIKPRSQKRLSSVVFFLVGSFRQLNLLWGHLFVRDQAQDVSNTMQPWYDYSEARDKMFEKTDTDHAPWHIVRSDDKRRARAL